MYLLSLQVARTRNIELLGGPAHRNDGSAVLVKIGVGNDAMLKQMLMRTFSHENPGASTRTLSFCSDLRICVKKLAHRTGAYVLKSRRNAQVNSLSMVSRRSRTPKSSQKSSIRLLNPPMRGAPTKTRAPPSTATVWTTSTRSRRWSRRRKEPGARRRQPRRRRRRPPPPAQVG